MASCSSCGREVGCPCNLTANKCPGCYAKDGYVEEVTDHGLIMQKKVKRMKFPQPEPVEDNSGFNSILKQKELTLAEKLKRINDILEQNRKKHDNQLQDTNS